MLDPMMATAATISATVSILKQWGATKIIVVCVLASKPGLAKVVLVWFEENNKKKCESTLSGGGLPRLSYYESISRGSEEAIVRRTR